MVRMNVPFACVCPEETGGVDGKPLRDFCGSVIAGVMHKTRRSVLWISL
jgi:hypothetical protein